MRPLPMLALSLLLSAAACSSGGGSSYMTSPGAGTSSASSGRTITPKMSGSAFVPAVDTVAAGSAVTWANQDGVNHTVTASPGSTDSFNSGAVSGGASFTHTFNTPGTYVYYCQIHGTPTSGMRGTIVVQ
jgi:plastocyanin